MLSAKSWYSPWHSAAQTIGLYDPKITGMILKKRKLEKASQLKLMIKVDLCWHNTFIFSLGTMVDLNLQFHVNDVNTFLTIQK